MTDCELLSKADVMREYKYPRAQLEIDLDSGKIAYFRNKQYGWGRLYIPRYAVENRIRELAAPKEDKA